MQSLWSVLRAFPMFSPHALLPNEETRMIKLIQLLSNCCQTCTETQLLHHQSTKHNGVLNLSDIDITNQKEWAGLDSEFPRV